MFSFIISLVALVVGYWLYGSFIERVFGADKDRPTPAVTNADGVDFIVLPS
ncbi:MAG: carbon starvation protein A, partial [Paludibacteraceae bacterium]|nr:carbon starvation protein A [Paludibacteraceae bacterium]